MEDFSVPVDRWPKGEVGRPVSIGERGATRSIRVRLDPVLDDRLDSYAYMARVNKSQAVRDLLERALRAEGVE
jgi:hypothetical protein